MPSVLGMRRVKDKMKIVVRRNIETQIISMGERRVCLNDLKLKECMRTCLPHHKMSVLKYNSRLRSQYLLTLPSLLVMPWQDKIFQATVAAQHFLSESQPVNQSAAAVGGALLGLPPQPPPRTRLFVYIKIPPPFEIRFRTKHGEEKCAG
jgi:hypothetical protein